MMQRLLLILAAFGALLVAGCSSGTPSAVASPTKYDFGNVPVTNDMTLAKRQEFVIKNEGTADLRLSNVQVKLLQGC